MFLNGTLINTKYVHIGQTICIPAVKYNIKYFNRSEVNLINKIRQLWEEHVTWTRLTILSLAANSPDTDFTINRLLRNPNDFGAQLKPLYGNELTSRFEKLFTDHLVIAASLVKAAIVKDNDATSKAEKEWYQNADDIAVFLARINPYWSQDEWRHMMHEHLALTKNEAVNRLNKNYTEDIKVYDLIEDQALKMADLMAYGMIRQFPSSF